MGRREGGRRGSVSVSREYKIRSMLSRELLKNMLVSEGTGRVWGGGRKVGGAREVGGSVSREYKTRSTQSREPLKNM